MQRLGPIVPQPHRSRQHEYRLQPLHEVRNAHANWPGQGRSACIVHYALGYTGLGVSSSRWGAGILRDLVLRPDSPRLDLRFVRSSPLPFPPEPLRTPAVELMRRAVIDADDHAGRRSWFLRAMDALKIGFDS